MGAGHADIGLVGCAILEDLFVGRGDMSVRAERGRYSAVEIATQKLLFAGGFGMNVDNDNSHMSVDALRIRSLARNGQSTGFMNVRPITVKTATVVPSRVLIRESSDPVNLEG